MALRIERIPVLGDNYTYLIVCEGTNEAAVVDAPEAEPVFRRVDASGVRVTKILSTHHHPDHSAANPRLAERYDVPVLGHESDRDRIPGFTHGLEEGDTVSVGDQQAEVLYIPCHTRGHIAYHFRESGDVFTGDTLFAAGCGRFFEGSPEMMFAAMRKLDALPEHTRIWCGHEYTESNLRFAVHADQENQAVRERLEEVEKRRAHAAADWHDATAAEMTIPSTLKVERETNPFLRASSIEEMGRLRAAKDSF